MKEFTTDVVWDDKTYWLAGGSAGEGGTSRLKLAKKYIG